MNNLGLIASLIFGIVASLLATFLFPALYDAGVAAIVRLFGWLPIKRHGSLSGTWKATWFVESERYPPEVIDDNVAVRQLGNRIYAKFRASALDCYLVGTIDAGRYITGSWYDETQGGYHGAFQFIIDPATRNFGGKWIGFSTSGNIKHGRWELERQSKKKHKTRQSYEADQDGLDEVVSDIRDQTPAPHVS